MRVLLVQGPSRTHPDVDRLCSASLSHPLLTCSAPSIKDMHLV